MGQSKEPWREPIISEKCHESLKLYGDNANPVHPATS